MRLNPDFYYDLALEVAFLGDDNQVFVRYLFSGRGPFNASKKFMSEVRFVAFLKNHSNSYDIPQFCYMLELQWVSILWFTITTLIINRNTT